MNYQARLLAVTYLLFRSTGLNVPAIFAICLCIDAVVVIDVTKSKVSEVRVHLIRKDVAGTLMGMSTIYCVFVGLTH